MDSNNFGPPSQRKLDESTCISDEYQPPQTEASKGLKSRVWTWNRNWKLWLLIETNYRYGSWGMLQWGQVNRAISSIENIYPGTVNWKAPENTANVYNYERNWKILDTVLCVISVFPFKKSIFYLTSTINITREIYKYYFELLFNCF